MEKMEDDSDPDFETSSVRFSKKTRFSKQVSCRYAKKSKSLNKKIKPRNVKSSKNKAAITKSRYENDIIDLTAEADPSGPTISDVPCRDVSDGDATPADRTEVFDHSIAEVGASVSTVMSKQDSPEAGKRHLKESDASEPPLDEIEPEVVEACEGGVSSDCSSEELFEWNCELEFHLRYIENTAGNIPSSCGTADMLCSNEGASLKRHQVAGPPVSSFSSYPSYGTPMNTASTSTGNTQNGCAKGKFPSPKKQTSLLYFMKGSSSKFVGSSAQQPISSHKMAVQEGQVVNIGPPQYKSKQCPFYKKIPGTKFTVDAFSYGSIPDCEAYFLSHFHYDHYMGLKSTFSHPIYCSKATGNLIVHKLRIHRELVHSLEVGTVKVINGTRVILIDANHCPGAVMFLFQLPNKKAVLHTGDFRAHTSMLSCPHLQGVAIDTVYLDTTYCDEQYDFPLQEEVVQFVIDEVKLRRGKSKKLLVACGSYTIGKERIFLGLAEALGCKVAVNKQKKAILDRIDDVNISSFLTTDTKSTFLHVLPMGKLTIQGLEGYLQSCSVGYDSVVGIKPTGWAFTGKQGNWRRPTTAGNVTIYGVPYSEHSSVREMKMFVQHLKPRRVIPTVSVGSEVKRKAMNTLIHSWMN